MSRYDAIVIGAGAAGLMCAIEAGKRGRRVAVIENADRPGKKILISGGGRCNFTNIHCSPDNFLSVNPHFAKSALARYTPADFIALVEKHRIPYHEKTLGQLFCNRSSRDILDMLEAEASVAGVNILLNHRINEVQHSTEYVVKSASGEFRAPVLVIASGGLSIPKMGATGFGYDVARQFGLKVIEPRPALVPFTFSAVDRQHYCDLAGVSTEVIASSDHHTFREKMLITHRGLSGPAILQISSYWKPGTAIEIDLAPEKRITEIVRTAKSRDVNVVRKSLEQFLPNRLAARWLELHAPSSYTNDGLEKFEAQLHSWRIAPAGTEGFEKAEVTAGGIDTNELDAKTMQSRKMRGLFFVGEAVDVTGQLGGFNFQWAWASGAGAGRSI